MTAIAALAFSVFLLNAQNTLRTTKWEAYGISFKAPEGFVVEDDSEDGYIISTSAYYITVQLLEGNNLKRTELADELKHIASEDEVTEQSAVTSFELPQFYGVQLKGNCESDRCIYCYLLDKDEGSGFYVSILYPNKTDKIPEEILRSFRTIE